MGHFEHWLRSTGVRSATLAACLGGFFAGCGDDTTAGGTTGGLVLSLQTNLSLPNDIDTIRVDVESNGELIVDETFSFEPELDVLLPVTFGLSPLDDPAAPIRIEVRSSQDGVLRTLRQVTTTIPTGRTALLRIPIDWLCYDQDNGSGSDLGDAYACSSSTTCIAGTCVDADVDSTTLPDYSPQDVFGGGAADAGGECFDTLKCFADGISADVDLGSCSIDEVDDATSVALVTKPGTRGICGPHHCLIPLDADSDYGWRAEGGEIKMPKSVCDRLRNNDNVVAIATTTACSQKTEALPTCGPWSSVGGQRLTRDAGLPENVSIPDGGSMMLFDDAGSGGTVSMPDSSLDAGMMGAGGAGGDGGTMVTAEAGTDASMDGGPGGTPGMDATVDGGGDPGPGADAMTEMDAPISLPDARMDAVALDSGQGICGGEAEACCADFVCDAGFTCAGNACTCADKVFGNMLIRVDGRLLQFNGSNQSPIRDQTTGDSLTDVTSAHRGHWHGCASRSDGSVWCWPADTTSGNSAGQLGNGTIGGTLTPSYATPVQVNPGDAGGPLYLDNIERLSTGLSGYLSSAICAVGTDGTLWCWGSDTGIMQNSSTMNEPYAKAIQASEGVAVTDAVEVSVGRRHACYRDTNGGVHCWGVNVGGPLGIGTQVAQTYPVQPIGLTSGVLKVVATSDVTCALIGSGQDAGRVRCFGSTGAGKVGIGPPAEDTDGCINFCKTTPARVKVDATTYLEGVVDIAAGYQTNCGLKSDGTLWCWGTLTGTDYAVEVTPQATPLPSIAEWTLHGDTLAFIADDGSYNVSTGSVVNTYQPNCGLLD